MARLPAALPLLAGGLATLARGGAAEPLPAMAEHGEPGFQRMAAALGNSTEGASATRQTNPLQFPVLTDFWCAWDLTDRKRTPALLIDDMQIEYEEYVRGIVPPVKTLIEAFRKAGLPIFWSTWWRFGPDDGFFNTMDRFYGPIGYQTKFNALYNHLPNGGDILSDVAPVTEDERRRVMHKSYSLDMFDERPMKWLVPDGQETLHAELQKLGVDTIVQVGAWTDDCIISTVFHGFSLQYDVVLVEDGVTTASKQHFNAIEVMRGAAAKVLLADQVASYIDGGLQVLPPSPSKSSKLLGGRAVRAAALAAAPDAAAATSVAPVLKPEVANLLNTLVVGSLGAAVGYLWGRRDAARRGSRAALLS
mmetsp:Transcript_9196/g.25838  ORF Transcript_9196/g.25838 Transcript_9196/m.25838 type:complete len:363 (+) Transcript_9196:3-1091(+)